MSVVNFLSFCPILTKLGTRDLQCMCQYAQNRETDFRNYDFKIFGEFLKFYIWT